MNLKDKILECLKSNPDTKFTAREIATWIIEHHPKDCEKKLNRSLVINDTAQLKTRESLIKQ
jgi:uncharacterized protein